MGRASWLVFDAAEHLNERHAPCICVIWTCFFGLIIVNPWCAHLKFTLWKKMSTAVQCFLFPTVLSQYKNAAFCNYPIQCHMSTHYRGIGTSLQCTLTCSRCCWTPKWMICSLLLWTAPNRAGLVIVIVKSKVSHSVAYSWHLLFFFYYNGSV